MYAQDNISASLDYFVTTSPPHLHQFSTISGGNCIIPCEFNFHVAWKGKCLHSKHVTDCTRETQRERYLYNGVDITDFTHLYACEEWLKINNPWPQIQVEKDFKSVGKMDGKAKALHKPVPKRAKALHKKIKSLTNKVAALQDVESRSQGGASDMGDGAANDDNVEAMGPRAFGKKCKAGN